MRPVSAREGACAGVPFLTLTRIGAREQRARVPLHQLAEQRRRDREADQPEADVCLALISGPDFVRGPCKEEVFKAAGVEEVIVF